MQFYALIVTTDLKLQRMWMTEEQVSETLKERKDLKIYRQSHDQEAVLQEDGSILWKTVPTVDKVG